MLGIHAMHIYLGESYAAHNPQKRIIIVVAGAFIYTKHCCVRICTCEFDSINPLLVVLALGSLMFSAYSET